MNYYLVAIFALIGYVLYKFYIYPLYLSPLRKIPSPSVDSFIFGHYAFLNNKQGEAFAHLIKQYGGLVRLHAFLNQPQLLISDQKLVQQIIVTHSYEFPSYFLSETLVKDLVGDEGISLAQGDVHKRQRKIMNPLFTFANVKGMLPIFVQAGHHLKDIWIKQIGNKKEERITITDLIPKITLDIIGLAGFNYEFNSTTSDSELSQAYHSLVGLKVSPLYVILVDFFPFLRKIQTSSTNQYWDSIKTINNISEKIITEQKNATIRGNNFLSLIVNANEKLPVYEQLTHSELHCQVMQLLIGGHETTSTALTWVLYYLAKNPDVQDRLRKEILEVFIDCNHSPTFDEIDQLKYLECVFKEVLRIAPPVPLLTRYNAKDEVMNGYVIPKGTPLMIPIYAIHHDPSIWGDDAEDFNPSRWLDPEIKSKVTSSNYLAFSAGPRSCLGMKMAHLEFKTLLL
ncbi:cytochrome P450 [Gigaspora margarita]|uniref:Cytochrome P450 n=1 Tax=Gigaspora margarita TaxID=4874 RepID=A0A8H4EPV8_GIGMA|nr:cytochrome P450 [Gigaspora margarita]